jgi:hypothetical protein
VPLEAAVELELEQRLLHLRGGRMTLADQFVNALGMSPTPSLLTLS